LVGSLPYQLFGPSSNLDYIKPHSLSSILPDMESAANQVEGEVRRLEEEADLLMESIRGTVGDLSDVRYGRLANAKLPEQVLDELTMLETSCK
jgi:centromere-localized protein 2